MKTCAFSAAKAAFHLISLTTCAWMRNGPCNTRWTPAVGYGLFRQELPANLHGLLAEKPLRLREALKASLARNIIPGPIGDRTDQVIQQLLSLAHSPVTKPYARAG